MGKSKPIQMQPQPLQEDGALKSVSGYWVGRCEPSKEFKKVPVSTIAWTLSFDLNSNLDDYGVLGAGFFDNLFHCEEKLEGTGKKNENDQSGNLKRMVSYILRGRFDRKSDTFVFEKIYNCDQISPDLKIIYEGSLEYQTKIIDDIEIVTEATINGTWENLLEQTYGTFDAKLEL